MEEHRLRLFKNNSDGDNNSTSSYFCHHTVPLPSPVVAPVPHGTTILPVECFPGPRQKTGFRPQLLNVLCVPLSTVIGLEV